MIVLSGCIRCFVSALFFPNQILGFTHVGTVGGSARAGGVPDAACLDAELCCSGPSPGHTLALSSLFPAGPSCDISSQGLRSGDLPHVWLCLTLPCDWSWCVCLGRGPRAGMPRGRTFSWEAPGMCRRWSQRTWLDLLDSEVSGRFPRCEASTVNLCD